MNRNGEENMVYEYKRTNGKIETYEEQAELVRQIIAKVEEYIKHPPKELVDAVIEEVFVLRGDKLTYEEAEKKVSLSRINDYVEKELGFKRTLSDEKESTYSGTVYESGDMLKRLKEEYPHAEIIDRETYEKVQEHIQKM